MHLETTDPITAMLSDPERTVNFQRAVSEWNAFICNRNSQTSHSSENATREGPGYDWLDSEVAQQIVDGVQLGLDSELDSTVRHYRLGLLRYLSKKFHILPSSLMLQEVKREGSNPVAGGGFADIWRGSLNGKSVCLKVLRFVVEQDESTCARMRKQFCHEALVWRQLNHPNILPLLGVNTELFFPSFCLVSPWMEHRDIITYLKQNPEHDLHSVLLEVAAGVSYLHSREPAVIHGDIRGVSSSLFLNIHHRKCHDSRATFW
ncbi:hypothetical protein GYMLUDRAFT_230425 [Collybiopsis luxurians FD-317 M1]|uniref:Protein kinase domain-containing protein n=1 Tax=Collybiopsis luxurians FD-317 M1 TaxID=944289 RepID=A0A0D0BML0_9AGAR|nr:hypothetical protein GYMLUDRAFT_230425 [Collybiopsis luxurians FD-317 M1]